MTESEILDMMLANIAPAGGGAKGSPSAASFEAQLKRIA
jgi:hypothetical protein